MSNRIFRSALLAGLMGLGLSAPSTAQTLADIQAAEAALTAAWDATPLTFRRALFVAGEVTEFGRFTARPSGSFAPDEPIVVYAEPVGFGWTETEAGFHAGFAIDMAILRPDGVALLERPNFLEAGLDGPTRNRDFMLLMTLELTGAEPGDYLLDYTVRDIASGETALISLPFSVTAAAPAPAPAPAPAAEPAPAAPR